MTNKTELLKAWTSLKERIITLLSDLDSFRTNQTQIIERYEKKLKGKNKEFEELEREFEDLSELVNKVRKTVVNSPNVNRELVLDILNKRK